MKKIKLNVELTYLVATILVALAVALSISSNFGISVLSGPAFMVHEKFGFSMTIGEYIAQFLLLIIFCIVMREIKFLYFFTFATALLYGLFLRLFQFIPVFNEDNIANLPLYLRIIFMTLSLLIMGLAIALYSHVYIYPQIYDFFILKVPEKYHLNNTLFKIIYDLVFLGITIGLSFLFFGKIISAVGIGTVLFAVLTGPTITIFRKLLDKFFVFESKFKKLEAIFGESNDEIKEV